jgi:hypothetical protein
MLFEKIYKNLCEKGKNLKQQWKPVGSGLERHRILPQHQGGTYVDSNCTYLTLGEHVIAHYLLWRINGNVGDREAYQMMSGINPNNYPSWLGRKHTPEAKKKMSEAKKGDKHPMYGRTGEKNPFYGKNHTEETKKKISERMTGMTGEKHPMYGRTPSEETKKKISEGKMGEKNPMYGRTGEKAPRYGRTGEKCPNSKKIKVIHLGIEKTYPSVILAAKCFDINYPTLKGLANGRIKTSRKYPGLRAEYI